MKKLFVLMASLVICGCAHHSINDPITVNTEIITSSADIFNNVTDAPALAKITNKIETEIRTRLRKEGIETEGPGPVKMTLALDYEVLEHDSFNMMFNQPGYTIKGRFKLTDKATKHVLIDEEIRQSGQLLSDFKDSVADDVVSNIDGYFE